MRKTIKKLFLGNVAKFEKPKYNPIQKDWLNLKAIWNNDYQDDNGLEKITRLFLASSQLFFPGIYIKYFASKKGLGYQDLALDLYILLKVAFPVAILINHWQTEKWVVWLMIYLLLETVLYIPTLIFASDLFSKPRSYKRSMLLLFFNYLEVVVAYGVLYSYGNYLNKPFTHWFDAIYFSSVTSASIGYGDYYPITTIGKFLVSTQSLLFLFFVVLFLNFFSNKIKTKGYFDFENKEER